ELTTATSFVEPEILQLSQEPLDEYLSSQELSLYRHYLDNIVRNKPHTLSPREAASLAAAGEMAQAPNNVFGMLNHGDLKCPFITDGNGQGVEVTHGRYRRLMESEDRRVRRDAFKAMHDTYHKWRNTVAAMYSASVRNDVFYARMRKHERSEERRVGKEWRSGRAPNRTQ